MTDLYSLSLSDITPDSIAGDPQVSSLITALDPELQEISRASLEPLIMSRIDELPENVIDLLAWQLHVDFYDLAGTLKMKREAVKGSILWHMHKGTQWAILEALRMIDIKAEFVHWHDSGAEPYTFALKAIVSGDFYRTKGRDKLQSSIRRAVMESKAARSWLSSLETQINFSENSKLYAGIIPVLAGSHRVVLDRGSLHVSSPIFTSTFKIFSGAQTLRPKREADIHSQIFTAHFTVENRDENLGCDLQLMQELLRQFEARIMARIDQHERDTQTLINHNQELTNSKLDEIKDMLRWKGDDEAL